MRRGGAARPPGAGPPWPAAAEAREVDGAAVGGAVRGRRARRGARGRGHRPGGRTRPWRARRPRPRRARGARQVAADRVPRTTASGAPSTAAGRPGRTGLVVVVVRVMVRVVVGGECGRAAAEDDDGGCGRQRRDPSSALPSSTPALAAVDHLLCAASLVVARHPLLAQFVASAPLSMSFVASVMPVPPCALFRSLCVRRVVRARAAWLRTVPVVMPRVAAISASGRSHRYRSTSTARCRGGRSRSIGISASRSSTPVSSVLARFGRLGDGQLAAAVPAPAADVRVDDRPAQVGQRLGGAGCASSAGRRWPARSARDPRPRCAIR